MYKVVFFLFERACLWNIKLIFRFEKTFVFYISLFIKEGYKLSKITQQHFGSGKLYLYKKLSEQMPLLIKFSNFKIIITTLFITIKRKFFKQTNIPISKKTYNNIKADSPS